MKAVSTTAAAIYFTEKLTNLPFFGLLAKLHQIIFNHRRKNSSERPKRQKLVSAQTEASATFTEALAESFTINQAHFVIEYEVDKYPYPYKLHPCDKSPTNLKK